MLVNFWVLAGCATHYTEPEAPSARKFEQSSVSKMQARPDFYTVKKGDTLSRIARSFGIPYQTLGKWNGISPPYVIHVGRTLRLFPKKQGDWRVSDKRTNLEIARKKRNSPQIKSVNSIANKINLKLYWHWPLKGSILKTYSVGGNKGIDIAGSFGQIVRAAAAGKVVYSGDGLIGYGNLLIIKHNDVFLSAYANNSKLLVSEGAVIDDGQAIAEVGGVGAQTYLHFEIRKNGSPVDPVEYLPAK